MTAAWQEDLFVYPPNMSASWIKPSGAACDTRFLAVGAGVRHDAAVYSLPRLANNPR